ncbi:MAG: NIPSNAP family protein [Dehalococcoidales bacterium]|nr:NIPSNAP family protein [Dehalococcoidales bacterium]
MIYELRIYDTLPGRLPNLHKRFAEHTLSLFEKHGLKSIGYWEEAVGQNNRLVYLLAFENLQQREEAWQAFRSDPEWQAAQAESEKDGQIVSLVTNRILRPTAYSPMK